MRARLADLRALQTLAAIVEEGSLQAAAQRLHYSQSAISMQLSKLETELGQPLLHRDTRGLRLTAIGERVVTLARQMLQTNRRLWATVDDDRLEGTVRIGVPVDLAPMLRRTWARFADLYPNVQVEVRSDLSPNLLEQLENDRLDLAVVTRPAEAPRGEVLVRTPLVWVGSPGTLAPTRDPLPVAVGPPGDCAFRQAAVNALKACERNYRIAYESQAFAALSSQIAVGLAVSPAIPTMVTPELEILTAASAGLPVLPEMTICLCSATTEKSRQVKALAQVVRELAV